MQFMFDGKSVNIHAGPTVLGAAESACYAGAQTRTKREQEQGRSRSLAENRFGMTDFLRVSKGSGQ